MRRAKSSPKRDSQPVKSSTGAASEMHYASASRARERDRLARSSGRGRGIFGACLSGRTSKLLILLAIGFAVYCFAKSNGYLDKELGELEAVDSLHVREKVNNEGIPEKESEIENNKPRNLEDEAGNIDDLVDIKNDANLEHPVEKENEISEEKETEKQYDHIFKYHVLQTLTNTDRMPHLKKRFEVCMKSILEKSSVDLMFFFVVDGPSKTYLESALQDITNQQISKSKFQFMFLDIDDLAHELAPLVQLMQSKIQGNHPYYKDSIFFLSTMLHMDILPEYVHRVIMLDTDLKFMSDIKELFDHFDRFQGDNIMGIVHEQQPVYRHIFSLYRSQNRGTRVGDPPPNGLTGFNSGVLLMDLDRMRGSEYFKRYLQAEKITELRDKYHFKGHLGDQDFYTLISMEKEDLFYNVPCSWNKQLCQWWKDKGYQGVWDQYFNCNEKINIYHGNCNTPIPY